MWYAFIRLRFLLREKRYPSSIHWLVVRNNSAMVWWKGVVNMGTNWWGRWGGWGMYMRYEKKTNCRHVRSLGPRLEHFTSKLGNQSWFGCRGCMNKVWHLPDSLLVICFTRVCRLTFQVDCAISIAWTIYKQVLLFLYQYFSNEEKESVFCVTQRICVQKRRKYILHFCVHI